MLTLQPLKIQSNGLSFSDWVAALTLCLAPLIAHMIAGIPERGYIADSSPKWHDYICFYNPTSIMWRYYAILSRRIRASKWCVMDMVTANTVFWTSHGWDGCEYLAVAVQHRRYWTRLPEKPLPPTMSILTTLVVAIQGFQATAFAFNSTFARESTTTLHVLSIEGGLGVHDVFFPVAILGLLRLFPALYLSDEHNFTVSGMVPSSEEEALELTPLTDHVDFERNWAGLSCKGRYRTNAVWTDRLLRLVLVGFLSGLWVTLFLNAFPHMAIPASNFVMILLYHFLIGSSVVTFSYYFARGTSLSTTAIPCINSIWFKLYTALLYIFMLFTFILFAIETRKTPCGTYTTWPENGLYDVVFCPGSVYVGLSSGALSSNNSLGLVATQPGDPTSPNVSTIAPGFSILDFAGLCLGRFNSSEVHAL